MSKPATAATFPLAKRGELGYDRREVDEFLARARAAYDDPFGEAVMTAAEVRGVSFKISKRGYAARFVDAAIDRLEEVFYERERRHVQRAEQREQWLREVRGLAAEVLARAGRPKNKKFRRRGIFAMGYKRSQVDAFVERAIAGLSGRGLITASQVRESLFHAEWRGYDEAQVDAFLDAITELILAER
ncbi:DivIVA domain-containing protein [Canibacter oris]|uniref:Cell wall synthesis protein Wag31 n=1 Tax=Canibacter oris TaxID=1365628 RepID=A0A840DMI0_9MICO|nr:DivIVA domain-containing protein [Canibacter oris]